MLLVTGGAGFIGSNFVLATVQLAGEPVVNLDKLTYAGSMKNVEALRGDARHTFVQGDIADRSLLRGLLGKHRPRAIVHLAAESHVDRSIEGPAEFIQTNVVGTFCLLEEARAYWSALAAPERAAFRPESFELLKSGVADGVFFPMESIISFKLETVLDQATLFPGGMYSSAFGFFMNQDKWDKLPAQDKAALDKLSGEHIARFAGLSWDAADKKGMDALKTSGVRIVNADAALQAEVKKRSAPIIEDWIAKAGAKGVNARAILDEFHAELKNVAAGR